MTKQEILDFIYSQPNIRNNPYAIALLLLLISEQLDDDNND